MSGIILPSSCCCSAVVVGSCCVGYASHVRYNHYPLVSLEFYPWEVEYSKSANDFSYCNNGTPIYPDPGPTQLKTTRYTLTTTTLTGRTDGAYPFGFVGSVYIMCRAWNWDGTERPQQEMTVMTDPTLTYDGAGGWAINSNSSNYFLTKHSRDIKIDPRGEYICTYSFGLEPIDGARHRSIWSPAGRVV